MPAGKTQSILFLWGGACVPSAEHLGYGDIVEASKRRVTSLTEGQAAVRGVAGELGSAFKVYEFGLDYPSADFTLEDSLSERDCAAAIAFGMEVVAEGADIIVLGAAGLGAATASAAINIALFGGAANYWAGGEGAEARIKVVEAGISKHSGETTDPLDILRIYGGREIAGLVGAILAARHQRIPILLDGYVSCTAAAILHAVDPSTIDHCIASHLSAEPAHDALLSRLGLTPVVDLDINIGDGTGGALALAVLNESVHVFSDEKSGLRAVIAVHNTARGPGAGGTRLWSYADPKDAVTDALRLSKAMSYKNAMAGLSLGGGKGVILRPETEFDRKAIFEAYGRAVQSVGGAYITAEDVGVSPDDMRVIKTQTDYVAGLDDGPAASGDPSPVTAEGVFRGIKVAARHSMGLESLKGLRVAVQGLGHVGYSLCEHLHNAGAHLIVTDINKAVLERAQTELGAIVVEPEAIHAVESDIFAPCALGGAVSEKTLPHIKASIIAGAANNQLATPEMGEACRQRGILYVPDYVLNAGGIINVAAEVSGHYDLNWIQSKLQDLEITLKNIFDTSAQQGVSTNVIADNMARERLR